MPSGNFSGVSQVFFIPRYSAVAAVGSDGDEFIGPLAGWVNVKTTYGAVGNGSTDDTTSFQNALNDLGYPNNTGIRVLYVPPGTYKITSTLTLIGTQYVAIIGDDPATTTIKWFGTSGNVMLWIDGVELSRFNRVTWDGNAGLCGVLIDQSATNFATNGRKFDTGNSYVDNVFKNARVGIRGGNLGQGAAESSVLRNKFLSLTYGVLVKNFNALDWWIWNNYFSVCTYAVSNLDHGDSTGAGAYQAYNNYFDSSVSLDCEVVNTSVFNYRNNFSINSPGFAYGELFFNIGCPMRVGGNTVINNGVGDAAVRIANMGPSVSSDNTYINNPANTPTEHVVHGHNVTAPDVSSIGDIFTATSLQFGTAETPTAGRQIFIENTTASYPLAYTTPSLPVPLTNKHRTVFEVAAGSSAATVQAAIDSAAALNNSSVVHLQSGAYSLATSLVVPANVDIQIIGDGSGSILGPAGGFNTSTPILRLSGPSRAVLRDFRVTSNNSAITNILISNADQVGGRIWIDQAQFNSSTTNLKVDGLDYARVEMHDAVLAYSTGTSIVVVGGAQAASGNPQTAYVAIFAAASAACGSFINLSAGASLLLQGSWYEGNVTTNYADISGNSKFSLEGSMCFQLSGGGITFTGFTGNALIVNCSIFRKIDAVGNSGNVWILGNQFDNSNASPFVSVGSVCSFNSNRKVISGESTEITDLNAIPGTTFIDNCFALTRALKPTFSDSRLSLANGVTDVRMHRIHSESGGFGLLIQVP